jgi:DNA invertase Pin-like site-specific DNA recombinase
MAKAWTASEMGHKGGKTRAERFTKRQIAEWGRQGGRPSKMGGDALARLRELLAKGKSQAECAEALGVSTRTIGRVVARLKGSDDAKAL